MLIALFVLIIVGWWVVSSVSKSNAQTVVAQKRLHEENKQAEWQRDFDNFCEEMTDVTEVHFENVKEWAIETIDFRLMAISRRQDTSGWDSYAFESAENWSTWVKRNSRGEWSSVDVYLNDRSARDPGDEDVARYEWRPVMQEDSSLIEHHYQRCMSFFERHPGWSPEMQGDAFWELKKLYIETGPVALGFRVWSPPVHS